MTTLGPYSGTGTNRLPNAPAYTPLTRRDPKGYVAVEGLADAVNVAILLGMPLLVTGDPGTGKTELAHSVAWEMGLPEPIIFNAKTTSTAQELFYEYDALGHFHKAHVAEKGTKIDAREFVNVQGLGLAILLSLERTPEVQYYLDKHEKWKDTKPLRAVVLIDEIDKAPRDLPNDILNEIERMSFRIRETDDEFKTEEGEKSPHRPIVILTSNSEKHLPEAFLRRCVYFHIPFPEDDEQLGSILSKRITLERISDEGRTNALAIFRAVRALGLSRKPATAELLNWLAVLDRNPEAAEALGKADRAGLASWYYLLAKTENDLEKVSGAFGIKASRPSTE